MKDQPPFKSLQGIRTFFRFRESRYPLHVTQQIKGPFHIPIAEGRLLLRCCGNVAYLFNRILGISSPRDNMECMELSSSSCAEIGVLIDLRNVSQRISGVAQSKPSQSFCMIWNGALLRSQSRGIGRHFKLISSTQSFLTFLR